MCGVGEESPASGTAGRGGSDGSKFGLAPGGFGLPITKAAIGS